VTNFTVADVLSLAIELLYIEAFVGQILRRRFSISIIYSVSTDGFHLKGNTREET
jgi:hypothetical protein